MHAEFDAKAINQTASELGVIKRLRKVNAYTLVLTVVLTVATRGKVSKPEYLSTPLSRNCGHFPLAVFVRKSTMRGNDS